MKRVWGALALVLILCVALAAWGWQQIHAKHEVAAQTIRIPHGAGLKQVAMLLEKQQVVSSAQWFRWYARMQGQATRIKQGEYHLAGTLSISDVLQQLVKGKVILHKVTVPEGLRTDDVLALLARQTGSKVEVWTQALQGLLGSSAWEGHLLPETYTYTHPLKPEALLKQMIQTQEKVLKDLSEDEAEKVRIMASIVEKETAKDKERPWVAAVIRNRLQRHMPLQMDPTVIYGIWKRDGVFSGNIHRKDLSTDTPWNSYTRKGLPPTPICNPGKASLKAAMHPADVDYLYFVADGTGGHAFASTLAEHQKNVRAWVRMERKQHAGK